MTDIPTKQALIEKYETAQASRLAACVIFRPQLTVWYIMIPVIFVYYFYRLNKYADSRKTFVDHYMKALRTAISAAAESATNARPPVIEDLVAGSRPPAEAKESFKSYLRVLVDHYLDLLKAQGDNYDTLLRKTYRTRSNYLFFVNRLHKAEKELNGALKPRMEKENPAVGETIALIERQVAQVRREEAERIFP